MLAFLFVVAEGKEACVLCVPPPYEVVEGVEQRGKGVPDRTQKLLQAPPPPPPPPSLRSDTLESVVWDE